MQMMYQIFGPSKCNFWYILSPQLTQFPDCYISFAILTFQLCSSFLIAQGGRHIDYVGEQVVTKLIDTIKKKNKGGFSIKPFQVGLQQRDLEILMT